MVIKVSVGDIAIEVPDKASIKSAIKAVHAIREGEPEPINITPIPDLTPPSKQIDTRPVDVPKPLAESKTVQKAIKQAGVYKPNKPKKDVAKFQREAAEESARLLIKSNQSFYLKDLCPPSAAGGSRDSFKKWLTDNFKVDIIPETAGRQAGLTNPLVVVPYTSDREGHKQHVPMPWKPTKEPVKGGPAKQPSRQTADEPVYTPIDSGLAVAS